MHTKKFIGTNTRRLVLTAIYLRGLFAQQMIKKSFNIDHIRELGKEPISIKHSLAKVN
jgi:hypothetical protein